MAFENSTMEKVSISEYAERYRYTVSLSSYADNTADKSEIVMDLWELK